MKTKTFIFSLLLLNNLCFSQTINWKPYFTLDPAEGISFIIDSTAIITGGVGPGINIANDGSIILGCGKGLPGRVESVTVDNGQSYTPLTGLITPLQMDGGFVYFNDGRTRFLCEDQLPTSTSTKYKTHVVSYISSDGKNWTREAGTRYQPGIADDSICSVPEVIQVNDTTWRMYYVGDWYASNGIRTAISHNLGLTWIPESDSNILPDNFVDPHPVYLTNGQIRLYCKLPGGIGYMDGDGLNFTGSWVQVFTSMAGFTNGKYDPFVIKFPNGKVACYTGTDNLTGTVTKIIAAWSSPNTGVNCTSSPVISDFYPNPVENENTLIYFLEKEAIISIRLLDMQGRILKTYVNLENQAPGQHCMNIQIPDNLPYGNYQLTISTQNGTVSVKLVR